MCIEKILALIAAVVAFVPGAAGAGSQQVRWHDEAADISRIEGLLASDSIASLGGLGAKVEAVGRSFLGTPYVGGTLEGDPEMLTIDTGGLDCTTFVELVAAIASEIEAGGRSWRNVADNLRDMRYRGGKVDGYASRLHYISDWIVRNTFAGRIAEVSDDAPRSRSGVKSLDFMTAHRNLYPALADSAAYAAMREAESGLRGIRFSYIPKSALDARDVKEWLRPGDIIFITTTEPGLDVAHAGVLVKDDRGEPHLMHASTSAGKVVIDPLTLSRYMARNKKFDGIRVVRLRNL